MDQSKLEALLGRPLTPTEVTNLTLYLQIAMESLGDLLCTTIEPVTEARIFDVREGYRTAFVDIFRSVSSVQMDGQTIDASEYTKMQWGKRNGAWYNSLVFSEKFDDCDGPITVTADWGFELTPAYTVPTDLQSLIAGLFDLVTKKNKFDGTVQSKQVEDFRISFNVDADLDSEFSKKHSATIKKYGMCNVGFTRHGEVC